MIKIKKKGHQWRFKKCMKIKKKSYLKSSIYSYLLDDLKYILKYFNHIFFFKIATKRAITK